MDTAQATTSSSHFPVYQPYLQEDGYKLLDISPQSPPLSSTSTLLLPHLQAPLILISHPIINHISHNKLGVKESNLKESSSGLDSKTEAIYAFRTITTMLSLIQSKRDTACKRQKLGQQEKLVHTQLQLLDAFAAVLVRNNGVITVTSKPYNHGSGEVEVLASYMGNGESHITSQPQSTGLIMNIIRNVFVSQNPR